MATKNNYLKLKALTLFFILTSQIAQAGQYGFSKDTLVTYFETSYFLTKANFDALGNNASLASGNQFSEFRFNLSASYDLTNNLGFYAKGSFKRADAISNTGVFGAAGLSETTNTNFSDFVIGANYLLFSKYVSLIPDVSISIPTYPQAGGVAGPLLGDGAIVVTGKMYATKRLRSFLLSVYGGYSYRNYGFSSLVPYGGLIDFEHNSIFIQGAINAAFSLNNDQYQANPLYRVSYSNAFDAGSLVYDSTDPSWVNGAITFGYRFSPSLFMTAGIEQSLIGYSTAQGTRFLIGLGYSAAPTRVSRSYSGPSEGRPEDYSGSENFEVDTDAEDQAAKPKRPKGARIDENSHQQSKIIAPIQ